MAQSMTLVIQEAETGGSAHSSEQVQSQSGEVSMTISENKTCKKE